MTQAGPLRWRTGAGWLVLAGGGSWQRGETGEVDAAALGWADLDRQVAVIPAAGTSSAEGEALLEYLADLGGPSGVVVPLFDAAGAQSSENCHLLADAGLIYIADGSDPIGLVRSLRASPALVAMGDAFERGAVVAGIGSGASALGAWLAGGEAGWGWLPEVAVEPRFVETKPDGWLQQLLQVHPNCLGLGIPAGIALGMGPGGRVVTVGEGQVTVVVGAPERHGA
jgi:cyanophycinase